MTRHNAKQGFAGTDHPSAVWANQLHSLVGLVAPHIALDPHHVLGGNAVCDADAGTQTSVSRLHNRVSRERRRNKHDARLGSCRRYCILNGIEYR